MSDAERVERLLRMALAPVEPPERLTDRLERGLEALLDDLGQFLLRLSRDLVHVARVPQGAFDRLSADAASVVRAGIKGLDRNRAVVVPGMINKVGAASTRFGP